MSGVRAALVLSVALTLTSARALAERSDAALPAAAPLLLRLAPTAESMHVERTTRLEQRLVAALSRWPNVVRAQVWLDLPLPSALPLDRALPAPRATVLLTRTAPGPGRADVFALLHASLPSLSETDLTLIEHAPAALTQPAADRALVSVGPFRVTADTAPLLRGLLGFSLAIHALFAGIVLWRLRLRRAVARKVDPHARTSFPS